MASHMATSSSAIAAASALAASARSAGGSGCTLARTRSRAQRRLIAVGRVALSCSKAATREASLASACRANISP